MNRTSNGRNSTNANEQQGQDEKRGSPPVLVEKLGSLEAAVWENSLDNGDTVFNVSVFRWYRDDDAKEWKKAYTFGKDDLPSLALLATKVTFSIQQLRDERRERPRQQAQEQRGNARGTQSRQTASAR